MSSDANEVPTGLGPPKWPGFLRQSSVDYASNWPLRAAVQAIPVLGGALDTMFAGLGSEWQAERLEDFLTEVSSRLSALESAGRIAPPVDPSEPLYDFVREAFSHVVAARSAERRRRLAALFVYQIEHREPWDDAANAANILTWLSDLEVDLLVFASRAPAATKPCEGKHVVSATRPAWWSEKEPWEIPRVDEHFPDHPAHALKYAMVHLASLGLVVNQVLGLNPAEIVEVSDLGRWFLRWLAVEPNQDRKHE